MCIGRGQLDFPSDLFALGLQGSCLQDEMALKAAPFKTCQRDLEVFMQVATVVSICPVDSIDSVDSVDGTSLPVSLVTSDACAATWHLA